MEFVEVPDVSKPQDRREARTYINLNQIAKVDEKGTNPLDDGVKVTLSSGDEVEAVGYAAVRILEHIGHDQR